MLTKTFTKITPSQFIKLRAQLLAHGVDVPPGNRGQVNDTIHHVVFNFDYDGTSTLTVTIIIKTWYIPEEMIWKAIQSFLGNSRIGS